MQLFLFYFKLVAFLLVWFSSKSESIWWRADRIYL